jgi:hypothetical protein
MHTENDETAQREFLEMSIDINYRTVKIIQTLKACGCPEKYSIWMDGKLAKEMGAYDLRDNPLTKDIDGNILSIESRNWKLPFLKNFVIERGIKITLDGKTIKTDFKLNNT